MIVGKLSLRIRTRVMKFSKNRPLKSMVSVIVSVEFDAICVTVHKISITSKDTISLLYCAELSKGVGKPSRA